MSAEGDNQYPVVGLHGYAVPDKPAATAPAPSAIPATSAVQHAQAEVDRALICMTQLDVIDGLSKLIAAAVTPSMQLRRDHLMNSKLPLEHAMSRIADLLSKLDDRIQEASKK
jgi:hypothetical protein